MLLCRCTWAACTDSPCLLSGLICLGVITEFAWRVWSSKWTDVEQCACSLNGWMCHETNAETGAYGGCCWYPAWGGRLQASTCVRMHGGNRRLRKTKCFSPLWLWANICLCARSKYSCVERKTLPKRAWRDTRQKTCRTPAIIHEPAGRLVFKRSSRLAR